MKKLLILSSLLLSLVGCGNVKRVQNTCLKEKTIYFCSVDMIYFENNYAYLKTYDFKKKKIYTISTIEDNKIDLKANSGDEFGTILYLLDDEEYVFDPEEFISQSFTKVDWVYELQVCSCLNEHFNDVLGEKCEYNGKEESFVLFCVSFQ